MIARHEELARPARPHAGLNPPDAPDAPEAPSADPIAAWLDVLSSLLRLPAPEKRAVRDELDNHLRERVRDLIITGLPEHQAAGKAIAELGDAASLAREYRAAKRTPTRRTLMNLAVIGLAAGGLITGLAALTGNLRPQSVAVSVFQPPAQAAAVPKGTVRFEQAQEVPWSELFQFLGKSVNMPVFVHWSSLSSIGDPPIEEGSQVTLRFTGDLPLDRAVELINDDLNLNPDNRIDFRVRDGRLTFASTQFFDRQESTLATYDLADLINQRVARGAEEDQATVEVIEQVSQLIRTLVHTDQWVDNGGDLAALTHYGTKLFVKAPKRFHPEIQWLLTEVDSKPAPMPKRGAADAHAEMRAFAIKHISADEALKALRSLESVRLDLAHFAYDPTSNSIIGRASPADQLMVAGALIDIDTPKRAQAQAERAQLSAGIEDLRVRLAALAEKRQTAEKRLADSRSQNDQHATQAASMDLAVLRDQEEAVKSQLDEVEHFARTGR